MRKTDSQTTAADWAYLGSLLSLDRVAPFLTDMGIECGDASRFKELVRFAILDCRQRFVSQPQSVPDFRMLWLSLIERESGATVRGHFVDWAENTYFFTHEDLPQWSAWMEIVGTLMPPVKVAGAEPAEEWQDLRLPPELSASVERHYRACRNVTDVAKKAAAVIDEPMTDWDVDMYARRNWLPSGDAFDPFGDAGDPMLIVLGTIEMCRFQAFARWLAASLPDDALDQLQKIGSARVAETRIWLPGDLVHPKALQGRIQ